MEAYGSGEMDGTGDNLMSLLSYGDDSMNLMSFGTYGATDFASTICNEML